MIRLTASALLVALCASTVTLCADGGPIETAATKLLLAQQPSTNQSGKDGMFWAGIALMGSGATMSILANTALRREECFFSTTLFLCVEESNKAVWATGVAIAAAGGILTTIGARKSITIQPGRITYKVRF